MKRAGLKDNYIYRFIDEILGQQFSCLIDSAIAQGLVPALYAEGIAEKRFLMAKESAERRNITGIAFSLGLELYRKGIIPYRLITPFASRYFRSKFPL